jgi:hypothetical protein
LARLIESGLELVAHNILENLDVLDLVSISWISIRAKVTITLSESTLLFRCSKFLSIWHFCALLGKVISG